MLEPSAMKRVASGKTCGNTRKKRSALRMPSPICHEDRGASVTVPRSGARLTYVPLERIPEVSKAGPAHPVVTVLCAVPFVQHARTLLDHELCPTECTVIVVPPFTIARVRTPDERHAFEVSVLPPNPPVVVVHDASSPLFVVHYASRPLMDRSLNPGQARMPR